MDWLDRMMAALNYLEEHMDNEMDFNKAANVACSSSFHFQRMFHMLTGVTVAEYVRKRRLTLAAQELVSGKIKVVDVALNYGYESPEAFCKAFRRHHGITPSAARVPGAKLKMNPRMSFHVSLKGDKEMNYKIIEKPAFKVIGKSVKVSTKDGVNFQIVPKFWSDSMQDGTFQQICKLEQSGGVTGAATLGICMDFCNDLQEFTYMIAVEKLGDTKSEGFDVKDIPASTWAVFESIGPMPNAIQDVTQRIFSEFFPSTGYEHAVGPELEVYLPGNPSDDDYRSEVWVPVVKK